MKVLIIGGTGAMGTPLVNLLNTPENEVYVTSRSAKKSYEQIHYLQGNAIENDFFMRLMEDQYDAIVDFLVYNSILLKERIPLLLTHTKQYIFFSSCRVFADSEIPIIESSPRLLDTTMDAEYLKTDEYALTKAKEENCFRDSGYKNWTIIRPYITYNSYRLQLGVYEKENWLRRALEGRTIVFPQDIANKLTTLSYGDDVAYAISKTIGNSTAYGGVYNVVYGKAVTWNEVLMCYLDVIEKRTGKRPRIKYVPSSEYLQKVWNPWQIKYDRLFNRIFDHSKADSLVMDHTCTETFDGLRTCLNQFLDEPKWLNMNWRYEAYCDRESHEMTPLSSIPGIKTKLRYLKWRFIDRR